MKQATKFAALITAICTLSSCATTQGTSGSSSQSFSGTVNNSGYSTFAFGSGSVPPRTLKISSFLPYGGLGSILSGTAVVYPAVMIKDESGNVSSANLISQKALEPSMFTSAHLETQYHLQLRSNTKYMLLVKAGNAGSHARVAYSMTTSGINGGSYTQHVNLAFNPASSGSIEIQLK